MGFWYNPSPMPATLDPARLSVRAQVVGEIFTTYRALRNRGIAPTNAINTIARQLGMVPAEVRRLIQHFSPTTSLAQDYLRANAFRLAVRAVRKANVAESLDILSRPNIGVLAQKSEGGSGQAGFFLSVSAETCGAVKIAAGVQMKGTPDPPAESVDQFGLSWDAGELSTLVQESLNEYDQQSDRAVAEEGLHQSLGPRQPQGCEPAELSDRPEPQNQVQLWRESQHPRIQSVPSVVQSQIRECQDRLRIIRQRRRRGLREDRIAESTPQESEAAWDAGTGDAE